MFWYHAWRSALFCTPDTVGCSGHEAFQRVHSLTARQLPLKHLMQASGPECKIATNKARVSLNQIVCGAADTDT